MFGKQTAAAILQWIPSTNDLIDFILGQANKYSLCFFRRLFLFSMIWYPSFSFNTCAFNLLTMMQAIKFLIS